METRCKVCRKKLNLLQRTIGKCQCDENAVFCLNHRFPRTHACTIDFLNQSKEKLRKNNPVIEAERISNRI